LSSKRGLPPKSIVGLVNMVLCCRDTVIGLPIPSFVSSKVGLDWSSEKVIFPCGKAFSGDDRYFPRFEKIRFLPQPRFFAVWPKFFPVKDLALEFKKFLPPQYFCPRNPQMGLLNTRFNLPIPSCWPLPLEFAHLL